MKKIITMLLFCTCLLNLTGCNINGNDNGNIKKLDSKIDYISFRNKKVYLSDDFEAFVLQFKGLGCKLNPEQSNVIGKIEIDDINSKEHEFYSLTTSGSSNTFPVAVECSNESSYFDTEFTVMFDYEEYIEGGTLYKNKTMDYWGIYPTEDITIRINGKELTFGGERDITKDDVINAMGTDYKETNSTSDILEYNIDKHHYSFLLSENGTVISITLEIY